ncbi:MAG: hypothetical protein AAGD86_04915, partial [Pseudomonadota bacterium]
MTARSTNRFRQGAASVAAALLCAAARPAVALEVEFSGCAVVLEGPRCVPRDDRRLTLWIAAAEPDAVRVAADGRALAAQQTVPVGAGLVHTVVVPAGATMLTVKHGGSRWRLPLDAERQPALFADALALHRAGDTAAGLALLEAGQGELADRWRGKALNLVGQLQRRLGNVAAADRTLNASIAASAAAGRRSEAIKTATVLSHLLLSEARDYGRARAVIEAQRPGPAGDAESAYDLAYQTGLVAFNAGNARVALRELERASAQAERMQQPRLKSFADSVLAVQLQRIGRHRLAAELL